MKYTLALTLTGPAPESESIVLHGFLTNTDSGEVLDETSTVVGYWEMSS
jgi:hypothetical protein